MAGVKVGSAMMGVALKAVLKEINDEVIQILNDESKKAAKLLVKDTKATAPENTGDFKKHITYGRMGSDAKGVDTWQWYVKKPDHRVTHLLIHPHKLNDGSLSGSNDFLENSCEKISDEFTKNVVERIEFMK